MNLRTLVIVAGGCAFGWIPAQGSDCGYSGTTEIAAGQLVLPGLLVPGEKSEPVVADEMSLVPLFNGKDLDGWEGDAKIWTMKDGIPTGQTTKENPTRGNTFLIWKGGTPADFELRMKVRYHGGNSGVQYRSQRRPDLKENPFIVAGYQADIGGGKNHNGKLYEEKGRGALANLGETSVVHDDGKVQVLKTDPDAVKLAEGIKDDEWFDFTIIARGNHLSHSMNGHTIIDCADEQKTKAAASGVIAFQIHAGEPMTVQFKDVRIREFKKDEPGADATKIPAEPSNGVFGTPGAVLIGGHEHGNLFAATHTFAAEAKTYRRMTSPGAWLSWRGGGHLGLNTPAGSASGGSALELPQELFLIPPFQEISPTAPSPSRR